VSADTTVERYLEIRPDGSVEEHTQLRKRSPKGAMETAGMGRPNVMNVDELGDEELDNRGERCLLDALALTVPANVRLRASIGRLPMNR
jgi:hypothetical protein